MPRKKIIKKKPISKKKVKKTRERPLPTYNPFSGGPTIPYLPTTQTLYSSSPYDLSSLKNQLEKYVQNELETIKLEKKLDESELKDITDEQLDELLLKEPNNKKYRKEAQIRYKHVLKVGGFEEDPEIVLSGPEDYFKNYIPENFEDKNKQDIGIFEDTRMAKGSALVSETPARLKP